MCRRQILFLLDKQPHVTNTLVDLFFFMYVYLVPSMMSPLKLTYKVIILSLRVYKHMLHTHWTISLKFSWSFGWYNFKSTRRWTWSITFIIIILIKSGESRNPVPLTFRTLLFLTCWLQDNASMGVRGYLLYNMYRGWRFSTSIMHH